ncbi:Membrane protein insertase YidC [Vibrio cholerae]|uniref:YidC/Oxa1 family insertase periplasmic-domain containing protein n=3 Tax=Vibrio TaxID=662 RepID=UPI002070DFAE|nr:membrane protein insertase YidC [Vibrio cholerae]MCX9529063.1 membrane protein insertase YidC [Vibrio cholerae]BCK32691.1 Membrane protein insertase YidC [Vibrio cholerae]BCN22134.1 putative membrane protein insertase [Vibrio cholerae]
MKLFFLQRFSLLGVLCLASVMAGAASPTTVTLSNQSLTMVIDVTDGHVRQWHPLELNNATAPIQNFAQPAEHLFVLKGTVAGMALSEFQQQAGGWQVVEQSAISTELALAHTNGISIHQRWQLDDVKPWQARYSVWMKSGVIQVADAAAATAELWLKMGPGIGEIPATGLGIAQNVYSFTQGVVSTDHDVSRVVLAAGENVVSSDPVDWLGLQSRYFALVMSLDSGHFSEWQYSVPELPQWYPDTPVFETVLTAALPVLTANASSVNVQIFGGAKTYEVLRQAEPALDTLLFPDLWSWMRALTIGLMYVLNAIFSVIGSWGVAILLLAVFVRLLIHPVAKRAMAAQKRFVALQEKIQPELKEIKRNYKGGEQSELILQLYERHKTSPFAGLKPLLIVLLQIPIFVALYHLLGQHFELRGQPFLWMNSLAEPDQLFSFGVDLPFFGSYFNLLPALMALTTLASIKLSPAPAADAEASVKQNLMLILMTLGFFLLFYSFPSGMVLYWTTANLLHLLHNLMVKNKSH